ncbi:MAG: hypothetical protein IJN37_08425 [Clostridia bacterium]|nr:hypothetical protein [Clostridia bacterium]
MTNMNKIVLVTLTFLSGGYLMYKSANREPIKYSLEWIKNLSNEDWEKERKFIQDHFRNPKLDTSFRNECKRVLDLFDKVKSDKDWAGKIHQGPAYHREHGFGLYKK